MKTEESYWEVIFDEVTYRQPSEKEARRWGELLQDYENEYQVDIRKVTKVTEVTQGETETITFPPLPVPDDSKILEELCYYNLGMENMDYPRYWEKLSKEKRENLLERLWDDHMTACERCGVYARLEEIDSFEGEGCYCADCVSDLYDELAEEEDEKW